MGHIMACIGLKLMDIFVKTSRYSGPLDKLSKN